MGLEIRLVFGICSLVVPMLFASFALADEPKPFPGAKSAYRGSAPSASDRPCLRQLPISVAMTPVAMSVAMCLTMPRRSTWHHAGAGVVALPMPTP